MGIQTSRGRLPKRVPAVISTAVASALFAAILVHVPGASASAAAGTIAFVSTRDGDHEIFTIAPDGSSLTQVTSNAAWDTDPSWSPDASKIAFSSNRDGDDDIYVMAAGGGSVINLTNSGAGRDVQPDWSPDGTKIAFVRDGDVYTVAATGGSAPVKLGRGGSPAWSPDGSKLAVIRPAQGSNDVYLMNPDGSGASALTSGLEADAPDWSPDGSKLAIESTAGAEGESRIVVVKADGTSPVELPGAGEDFAPSWSPDGNSIVATNVGLDADVVVMTLDGHRRIVVSGASYDFLPAWSPCPPGSCPEASPSPTSSASPSESPTASPTESPTASPTASPTESPAGEREPTSMSLQFLKTKKRIKAAGAVRPAHPGVPVRVLLSKRKSGRWVKVALKRPLMDGDGTYSTGFRNPARTKRCRLKARFAGDADHLPSKRIKRFRC